MITLFDEEYIREAYELEIINQGRDEQAQETAQNMHRAGMSDEVIAAMINRSIEQVRLWLAGQSAS